MPSQTLAVDVISDVMCPWCYIGKRRLEAAAALLAGEVEFTITWRPFQLDPSLPPEGLDRKTYLENKFGGAEAARNIYARVEEEGLGEGIDFAFEAIAKSPNTLDAHRVIRWAGAKGHVAQSAVVEQIFRAYFLRGENIGDHDILASAVEEAGVDMPGLKDALASARDRDTVSAEIIRAGQIGVTGVPCFIFGQRLAVMGAHPAESLAHAARQALLPMQDDVFN